MELPANPQSLSHALPNKIRKTLIKIIHQRYFFLFLLPGFASMVIFNYLPLYGLVGAFQVYDPFKGFFASPWIGLKNFELLVTLPDFSKVIFNTLNISFWSFIFGFPAPIILAILFNEIVNVRFKKVTQTISYIPNFISWVVASSIFYKVLAGDGVINDILLALGLIKEPIYFLNMPSLFIPTVVVTGLWKSVGFSSILFLAVLTGINPELYEAADIDGAGKLHKTRYVTIPGIMPTIVLMLVLSVSNILSVSFDQIYTLQNALNISVSDVLDTYIYRIVLSGMPNEYSRGLAFGFFRAIICIFLFIFANRASKKLGSGSVF